LEIIASETRVRSMTFEEKGNELLNEDRMVGKSWGYSSSGVNLDQK
jgi:hypothetical protein